MEKAIEIYFLEESNLDWCRGIAILGKRVHRRTHLGQYLAVRNNGKSKFQVFKTRTGIEMYEVLMLIPIEVLQEPLTFER